MPVPALAGGLLFFACPKKSSQKKRPPDAACFLRSVVFIGVCWKGLLSLQQSAASLPHPFGLFPIKSPVLGAA
ncbi:hypothetical protein [Methyloglobulus morosus]|uniref:hypothetical protein n=1 Tax=Methyloglobulus morosus TaxID=1410681 RepID=UPI00137B8099|nr:hypothetical protein [Methyloglobulus morosus]